MGHALMENRQGLAGAGTESEANGAAHWKRWSQGKPNGPAGGSLWARTRPMTAPIMLSALRAVKATPHATQNESETKTGKTRRSAVDGRRTRHMGYTLS